MSCWPEFELRGGIEINQTRGIYGNEIKEVMVCPYPFYSFSINSNGTVSPCFIDWSRKLLVGDIIKQSVKEVWDSQEMKHLQKLFLKMERKNHPVCKDCGQLTHAHCDNIDEFAKELLERI